MVVLVLARVTAAGETEEERWYNAEGEVVKTVKKATSEDGGDDSWEPAWVLRERARDERRIVRYASPRAIYGGYRSGWNSLGYPVFSNYYGIRSCGTAGVGRAGGRIMLGVRAGSAGRFILRLR